MESLHDLISRKSRWYQKWHEHPLSNLTHWVVFLLVSISATVFVVGVANAQVAPTVTTEDVQVGSITSTSTILVGNVTDTGDGTLTEEGFLLAIDQNYFNTAFFDKLVVNYGSVSAGTYTYNLVNLQCNKTYYYKAYASSTSGRTLGNTKSFTTLGDDPSCGKWTYKLGESGYGISSIRYNGMYFSNIQNDRNTGDIVPYYSINGQDVLADGSSNYITPSVGPQFCPPISKPDQQCERHVYHQGEQDSWTNTYQLSTVDADTMAIDIYVKNNSTVHTISKFNSEYWLGNDSMYMPDMQSYNYFGKFRVNNTNSAVAFIPGVVWGSLAMFTDDYTKNAEFVTKNDYENRTEWNPWINQSTYWVFNGYDPIPPGEEFHYTLYLRVGGFTGINSDVVTAKNLAPEAYDAFYAAPNNQYLVNWPNRAPIAYLAIANTNTLSLGATNPRKYSFQNSFTDVSDLASFKTLVLNWADSTISHLNSQNPKPQAVAVWDLEGQEFSHTFSYVGYPNKLHDISPEMDAVADEFFAKFRKAGYGISLTLRPDDFMTGTTLPPTCNFDSNENYLYLHNDIFIKTDDLNYPRGGYQCTAPNTWTHLSYFLPADQHYPDYNAGYLANLESKVAYARARWGVKSYYVDTTIFAAQYQSPSLDPSIWRTLQKEFPDCIFFPENISSGYYNTSAPYVSAKGGAATSGFDTPQYIRDLFPMAFSIIRRSNEPDDTDYIAQNPTTFQQSLKNGNLFYYDNDWYAANTSLQSLYQTVGYTPAPVVSITAPLNNHTVTGSSVTLTANSTYYLNSGIKGIKFQLDGNNIGPFITSTSSPNIYSTSWDSTTAARGDHTLQALSYDYIGNIGTTSINITVDNGVDTSPAINTQPTTDIAQTTATFNGYLVTTGGQSITQSGFKYGTDPAITQNVITTTLGSIATGTLSQTITGLTASTTYYVKSYATNAIGTTYGTTTSFTTLALVPIVSTLTPDVNSGSTIIANGSITNVQGANATIRGFVYGTSLEYATTTVLYGHYASTTGSYGVSTYSIPLTGLNCNTAYHVVAFATNSRGTGYGSDQVVTTGDCSKATVTDLGPTSITTTGAILNASTIDDGNASSTAHSFYWGTDTNYGDGNGIVTQISEIGLFGNGSWAIPLTGLKCSTTYHYNAYAQNYKGKGTTGDKTFTTKNCISQDLTYVLKYSAGSGGSISGSSVQNLTLGSDGTTVTAVPNQNYHFVNWNDGSTTVSRQDTNVNSDHTFIANFVADGSPDNPPDNTTWYSSSWTKRKVINITNNVSSVLTNYQVKIHVTYDSAMLPNFDDIRFTSSDGITLLSYWLEPNTKSDSVSVDFWVKIPSLPASDITKIFMYYGNPSVGSISNGDATFLLFDDFKSAPSGTWVPSVQNPVITSSLSFENGYVRDAKVLYENGQYEMWYWGNLLNLGYATSSDGINWTKVNQLNISCGRPSVVHHSGTYYLFTNLCGWDPSIYVSTSANPEGPFTTPVKVLEPTLSWENSGLYVPSVIFDSDDGVWKMWYSADQYTPQGVGYTEPKKIGYATSNDPLSGWTKNLNPILVGLNDNSWTSSAIQSLDVDKVNGVYYATFTGSDYWGIARTGFASTTNPIVWNISPSDLILNTGQTSLPNSWNQDFVYATSPLYVNGQWSFYFNGRNNTLAQEQTGVVYLSNSTSSNVLDTSKWLLSRRNNISVNSASSLLTINTGTSNSDQDASIISNKKFTDAIVEARTRLNSDYNGQASFIDLGFRSNGTVWDPLSTSFGNMSAYETYIAKGSSLNNIFYTGKHIVGVEYPVQNITTSINKDVWYIQGIGAYGNKISSYLNGSLMYSATDDDLSNAGNVFIRGYQSHADVDWVRVRSYANSEPSVLVSNIVGNSQNGGSFTLTYSAGSGGSITSGQTSQTITSGANGTPVTATANSGYHFTQWSDGSTTPTRMDINVLSDNEYTANFAADTVYVTLHYNANTGGSIYPGSTTQVIVSGTSGAAVTASSSYGYYFVNWSPDNSTQNPRTDTNVTADHTYTATFALIPIYRLTYVAGSHGSINGSTTQDVFSGNNGMSVTASANTGYHFVDWSDGSTNPSRTDMNVTNNHTYTANFAVDAATYTITYSADSNGSITGTTSQTINSGGNGTPVTAVPDSGYHFTQWSDGSTTPTRRDTNVTADHTYTATFVQNAANYTITYTANTGGTITGTLIQSITSGGTGSTVTAIPNQGFHFVNWNDNSTNPIRIDSNVTADHTFTASFAANSGGNNNNSNNNTTPTNTVTYGSSSGSCVAPYKFTRSLAIGSTGDDVKSLQFFLTRSGFTASSTGIYDKATAQAVTNFQNYYATEILAPYKLKSGTGYFGPSTIKKVNSLLGSCGYIAPVTQSTPTPTPTPSGTITSTLTLGMNNNQVKLLQQILNAKGYTVSTTGPGSPGNESNYYGQKTVAALQKFQCDKLFICSGSPTTNGYGSTGPRTRALLNGTTYTPPPKVTTPVTPTTVTPKVTTPPKTTTNSNSNISNILDIFQTKSTPTSPPSTPTNTISTTNFTYTLLTHNLTVGSTGQDVLSLQKFLNNNGFTITTTGSNSPGKETGTFDQLTKAAVIKFQNAHKAEILTPYGLTTGDGEVGVATIKVINALIK